MREPRHFALAVPLACNQIRKPRNAPECGEMSIDRRVLRTRNALYDALVSLILEKDYEAINLDDILTRANVGRSTFYSHFRSKDELLERSLERLRELLVGVIDNHAGEKTVAVCGNLVFSQALFRHVAEYRAVYFALKGRDAGGLLQGAIRKALTDALRQRMASTQWSGMPGELAVGFIVSTFWAVLSWWLDRNPLTPPDEAERLFRQLVTVGLAAEQ
jgi:AcrR family transcriptional regulator